MSFDSDKRRPGFVAYTVRGKLAYIGPVNRRSLPFVLPYLLLLVAFGISGFFLLKQPLEDRLEYIVALPLLFKSLHSSFLEKDNPIFFWIKPAFFIGCLWGGLSLFLMTVSFNPAAYVFCYCGTTILMLCLNFLKHR